MSEKTVETRRGRWRERERYREREEEREGARNVSNV